MQARKIILLLILIVSIMATYGQQLDPRVQKANELYNVAKYEEAKELYEQVVNEGNFAPELYYNLANTYYKNNEISKAILYYERALRLKPDDEDVKFNLQMANLRIIDKMETIPQLPFLNWWEEARNFFSMDGWAILALLTLFLALGLFNLYLLFSSSLHKKIFFFSSILLLVITMMSWSFAEKNYQAIHSGGEAIVTIPTLIVKGSPTETGTDLFVIHEGLKVTISENVGDWYKITLPNGNQGWLKVNAVEII